MKTFNDLQPGDNIYKGNGDPCKITRTIPTHNDGKRIYFNDFKNDWIPFENNIALSPEQIKESIAVPFGRFTKPYFTCLEAYDEYCIKQDRKKISSIEAEIKYKQKIIELYKQDIEDIKTGKKHNKTPTF